MNEQRQPKRLKIVMDIRPHPGPLPQERENRAPASGKSKAHFGRAFYPLSGKAAATASEAKKYPDTAIIFPLSPGESAGVRAGVISSHTNFYVKTHCH
jgi:hypothetical protein